MKLLPDELANQILPAISQIADSSWWLRDEMKKLGWNGIQPRVDFERSFAADKDEVEEYEKFVTAEIKLKLQLRNQRYFLDPSKPVPVVEYLEQLRARNQVWLGETFDPRKHPFWKGQLSRCLRRLEQMRGRPEFRKRITQIEREERELRDTEVRKHSTRLPADVEQGTLKGLVSQILVDHVQSLGFQPHADRLVYSRPFSSDFHLFLTVEPLLWFPGTRDGNALLLLSIQRMPPRASLKSADPRTYLLLEYLQTVRHFEFLYRRFRDSAELETILLAQLSLLSLFLRTAEPLIGLSR
jgi:hypothetical protein